MSNSKALLQGHSKSISSGLLSGAILYDTHSADGKRLYNGQLQSAQPSMLLALCYPKAYVLFTIAGRVHMAKFILVLCSLKDNVTGGLYKQWLHAILNHFS